MESFIYLMPFRNPKFNHDLFEDPGQYEEDAIEESGQDVAKVALSLPL